MTEPFVRLYEPLSDFEPCLQVFQATIDSTLDFEQGRRIGSYLWYRAYVLLAPSTCYVLDDGSGTAVGYIIGTPSTTEFIQAWKSALLPSMDSKLFPESNAIRTDGTIESKRVKWLSTALYDADCSALKEFPDALKNWPSHLHINIMPSFQKKGYGEQMMQVFTARMRSLGASGVHLGAVSTNSAAIRFYERLGFARCDIVLDGGKSGETGRLGNGTCMTKTL